MGSSPQATDKINKNDFSGVRTVPTDLYNAHARYKYGACDVEAIEAEKKYQDWKDLACKQVGATILIDDREYVAPGLKKFGIKHMHPNEL